MNMLAGRVGTFFLAVGGMHSCLSAPPVLYLGIVQLLKTTLQASQALEGVLPVLEEQSSLFRAALQREFWTR
jgi:hypothetical protein